MTRLLWLQHRGQALWAALTLAAICALMLAVGRHAADAVASLRGLGCLGRTHPVACERLVPPFAVHYGFTIPVFEEGVPSALVIIAALVGAPLVAREIEHRTQLVVWTQSVSRQRWYAAKVLSLAACLAIAGLVAGVANDQLQRPLTDGGVTESRWPWFFSIDLAPAGETLLAFALAVALGAWLRRTLPAIGAALAGFLVLLLATAWAVRTLTPLRHATGPRDGVPSDAWHIQSGSYHPASQYWPLQLTYLGILLALTTALLAAGWHATRTRAV